MKDIILFIFFTNLLMYNNKVVCQVGETYTKQCGSCKKPVSNLSRIGMKCPHCKVIWGYENQIPTIHQKGEGKAFQHTIDEKKDAQNSVKNYLNSLGSNCNKAFSYIRNKKWQAKGLHWFCSADAFGSVTDVYNITTKYVNSSDQYIKIKATYSATDITNGNGTYVEIYSLKETNGKWYIYKVERVRF